ncbi:MAG: hypothetical protein IPJ62_18085 [Betaproteobacteria bacterium]|nr:hypothetical protein [Betaproteobacteria bacterium]
MYTALLDFLAQGFNAAGFAVFSLDRFAARGVQSTTDDQYLGALRRRCRRRDCGAPEAPRFHPRIDPADRGHGVLRGGIATIRTALERVIAGQSQPDGLRFAAHVLAYSRGCVGVYRVGNLRRACSQRAP